MDNIHGEQLIVKNTDHVRDLNDVKIINCNFFTINFEKVTVNQEENEIHLLTDSSTIKFKHTEFKGKCNFSGKANTILNENSKFNKVTFIGDNSPYRIHYFDCREVNLVGNFDSIDIRHSKLDSLITNEIQKTRLLNISSSNIEFFIISNPNIQKLNIQNIDDVNTQIGLLKYDNEIIDTYCDGFGQKVSINKLNFNNCNLGKEKTLKFYGVEIYTLEFNSFLNYGNLLFTDVKIKPKTVLYGSQGFNVFNSDLGKTVFMNCDFKQSIVHFLSSKINEIFLAGVEFPEIKNENYRTISEIDNYEQKRLCYTQLKKIYDSRGDSLNSTKFHKAELEVWEKELQMQEKEEKKSGNKNNNWLKKIKLKIFNWISFKLFPEYWNLSILNLEHKKLIYSQYKKMYEGRGDTIKAIEYQGKELDVHRAILRKTGGQYWERFQLSLNKFSNNFGQSWQWAILGILVLGVCFYCLYCYALDFKFGYFYVYYHITLGFHFVILSPEEENTFWTLASYFFEFINPIRKGEFIKLEDSDYVKVTGWARVIDFFWRIVITYLGYQLIQAFRKYSKKTS